MNGMAFDSRYLAAIGAGFGVARQHHRPTGPVHFLVGIAQGDGPAARALGGASTEAWRRAAESAPVPPSGPTTMHMQAQQAAREWAETRREITTPEHLLVALLDQGSADVVFALSAAGADAGEVRATVLGAMGAPRDLPGIPRPALSPAGTLDHLALPVASLPAEVWEQLRWRQEHLPRPRLRRPRDWESLYHL
jgi:Clp amino terminal domain, pathogenicity island component